LNSQFQSTAEELQHTSDKILLTCYEVKAMLLSQEEILTPGFVQNQDLTANFNAQFFSLKTEFHVTKSGILASMSAKFLV